MKELIERMESLKEGKRKQAELEEGSGFAKHIASMMEIVGETIDDNNQIIKLLRKGGYDTPDKMNKIMNVVLTGKRNVEATMGEIRNIIKKG